MFTPNADLQRVSNSPTTLAEKSCFSRLESVGTCLIGSTAPVPVHVRAASSADYTVNLRRHYSSLQPLVFAIRSPKEIACFVFLLIQQE
jgi:hypothetical protein